MAAQLATLDDFLFYSDEMTVNIQREVDRIEGEAHKLGFIGGVLNAVTGTDEDALGFTDQADAVQGFLEQSHRFLHEVYPPLRAQAEGEQDMKLAQRLANACENIYGVTSTTSPTDDEIANAKQFVNDTNKDLAPLVGYPVFVAGGALVGAAAAFSMTANPRAVIAGAVLGAVAGAGARYGLGRFQSAVASLIPGFGSPAK